MTFHFKGADLQLTKQNVILFLNDTSVFCVGFMRNKHKRTIIGAWQQHNIRFIYDLKDSVIRFGPENCLQDS